MSTSSAVLEAAAQPVTVSAIAEATGKNSDTVRKAVAALVADGQLAEAGKSGRAKLFVRKAAGSQSREAVAELDRRVFDVVSDADRPLSKYEIADAVGAPVSKTYIALHRLGVGSRYDFGVEVVADGTRTRKYRAK